MPGPPILRCVKTCPSCGRENADDARFCSQCATSLEAQAPAREERKVVTCLFCDLVGFTARAESMDPEDVRRLLQPYHARGALRARALRRHRREVHRRCGDGRVRGTGQRTRTTPSVRCERRSRSETSSPSKASSRSGSGSLPAKRWLRSTPGPDAGEGMASGDVVNTAARLQSAASPGAILVDETTFRATERAIELEEAPPVDAKGKSSPVPVWEALRARARVAVERTGGAALVGREEELALLRGTLDPRHPRASNRSSSRSSESRDRQEPARLRALPDDRDRRARARVLATWPFAPVWRRRDLLGTSRDGQSTGGDPRIRQRRAGWREAPSVGRATRRRSGRRRLDRAQRTPARRARDRRCVGRRPARRVVCRLAALARGHRRRATARPRLRGSALGGRRAPRLRGLPGRMGERCPDPGARDRSPRAPLPSTGLGRRKGELVDDLAVSPLHRGDHSTPARPPRPLGARRRPSDAATRARRRQPALCRGVHADARRLARARWSSRRPCKVSSPPGSTRCRPRRRRCSRTQPSSGGSSGSEPSAASDGRSRVGCTRLRGRSS